MSSSDRGLKLRHLAAAPALALAGALALSACTVQPLYAPTVSGKSVPASLSGIAIEEASDRVAQQVRNNLVFMLGANNATTAPTYRMKLTVASVVNELGVTPVETAPSYSVTVSATYELTSVATGAIVQRGTVRGTASYDRVTQVYANTRARLDAENRAAADAAEKIRLRLSTDAAKGTI